MAHLNLTAATAEAQYQAFYAACTAGEIEAETSVAQIDDLFARTRSPVIKSYCLLFYSAVVDTNALNASALSRLSQHLTSLLEGLSDFRVKDRAGRYVHFLSHATYLAQSIHDAGGNVNWKPLLAAYLRSDEAFGWNEDIVLAECLLSVVPKAEFPVVLAQLRAGEAEGPKASNKRALWLAMKVLNERAPRVDDAAFSGLVGAMAALVE